MAELPPRRSLRSAPFIFGLFCGLATGLSIALFAAGIIWLKNSLSSDRSEPVIAVSWGARRDNPESIIYQAIVQAAADKGSDYTVSAKIYIASDNYYQDVGTPGTVPSTKEAVRKFGTIRWTPEEVTFGSETGVAAAVKRQDLERHR